MRLAHVTDLHLGAEDPAVLDGLRADLAAQRLDRILVSGDLTMRARAKQFRAARALLDDSGVPWTAVPGNHDVPLFRVWSRVVRPLGSYRKHIHAQPEPVLRTPDLALVGLSSPRRYLWKGGRIGAGQVARIGTAFREPAPLKVLMLHHPVFRPVQRPREALVIGVDRALRAAARAGVDVVLFGHGHVPAQVDLSELRPGLRRRMIGLMSGTACSWRVRGDESQSYTVLDLIGDELTLRVRQWRAGRFEASADTVWQRSPDGWATSR